MSIKSSNRLAMVVLLLTAGAASSQAPLPAYRVQFGLFRADGRFTPSRRLPLREHQGYGWVAQVPQEAYVHWREILTVPRPPRTWGGLPTFDSPLEYGSVSRDRRTGIVEGDLPPVQGRIMHAWEVAPGDPSGSYHISVILDGHRVGRATFEARRI